MEVILQTAYFRRDGKQSFKIRRGQVSAHPLLGVDAADGRQLSFVVFDDLAARRQYSAHHRRKLREQRFALLVTKKKQNTNNSMNRFKNARPRDKRSSEQKRSVAYESALQW